MCHDLRLCRFVGDGWCRRVHLVSRRLAPGQAPADEPARLHVWQVGVECPAEVKMSEPAVAEIKAKAGDRKSLRALRSLVDDPAAEVMVAVGDETVALPRAVVEVLRVASGVLVAGDSVAMVSEEAEVTPAEAARLLGVSRQYVDRLIESGVLPIRRLPGSSYRKIPARAVLAHRTTRERKRAGIQDIVDGAVDAGLEY